MHRSIVALLALTPLAIAACASSGGGQQPPESNRMAPEYAPTPFSADEIRAGCARGRKIVLKIEQPLADPSYQVFHFQTDARGITTLESWTEGADRKRTSEVTAAVPDWSELQGHASFPKASTRITVEEVTVPIGTFRCWVYDVDANAAEGPGIPMRYCFAMDRPGPPILLQGWPNSLRNPTMTMVEDRR